MGQGNQSLDFKPLWLITSGHGLWTHIHNKYGDCIECGEGFKLVDDDENDWCEPESGLKRSTGEGGRKSRRFDDLDDGWDDDVPEKDPADL